MTFSAKKLKQVKICLLHCKKHFISLERKHFHVLSFALKIAFRQLFLTETEVFEHPVAFAISSFALNTELVLLEAIKK